MNGLPMKGGMAKFEHFTENEDSIIMPTFQHHQIK
jgi:hypothetical protein